jgi:hypothetical protein
MNQRIHLNHVRKSPRFLSAKKWLRNQPISQRIKRRNLDLAGNAVEHQALGS